MQVDLRGPDIEMTKKFFYISNVGAFFQQMGGKAVTQAVNTHILANFSVGGYILNGEVFLSSYDQEFTKAEPVDVNNPGLKKRAEENMLKAQQLIEERSKKFDTDYSSW